MKKILILLVALVLVLSGCTKEHFERKRQKQIDEFLAGAEHNPALFGKWERTARDSDSIITQQDTIEFKKDGRLIHDDYQKGDHRHFVEHWRTRDTFRLDVIARVALEMHARLRIINNGFIIRNDSLFIVGMQHYREGNIRYGLQYRRVK